MIYLIIGIIALLYLCCFSTWEHMTNSDVKKKLEHHKTATTWDSVHKPKKIEETSIKGPQITAKEAHEQHNPEPSDDPKKSPNYPDIYGPDILLEPGHKDNGLPGSYDFLPANEFPAGPKAPSPFLTDFSKILRS